MTETIILLIMIVINTFAIMISFILGLHYGQKVVNNEKIEKPKSIVNIIKEKKEEKEYHFEQEKQQSKLDKMLANIDNYDGTGNGQRDI